MKKEIGYKQLTGTRLVSFAFLEYLIEYDDVLKRPVRTIEIITKEDLIPYEKNLKRPGYTNDDWNHGDDKLVKKRVDLIPSLGGHQSHLAANADFVSNSRAQYFINVYSNLLFMFPSVNMGTYQIAEMSTRLFVILDTVKEGIVISGSIDKDEELDDWRKMMWSQFEIDVPTMFFKSVMLFNKNGKYDSVSWIFPNVKGADYEQTHSLVVNLKTLEEATGPLFNGIDREQLHEFTADELNAHDCYKQALAKVKVFRSAVTENVQKLDVKMLEKLNFKEDGNSLVCNDALSNGHICTYSILKGVDHRAQRMVAHFKQHEQRRTDGEPKTVD